MTDGNYASEDNLQGSIAFLRQVLGNMGLCKDLNLQSSDPADVVESCNTIYGLLLQNQQDAKYKEQMKQGASSSIYTFKDPAKLVALSLSSPV